MKMPFRGTNAPHHVLYRHMNTILHWFTTDLRLHDMPSLRSAKDANALLPVYVIDPQSEGDTMHGFQRIGPIRKTFTLQTVYALKEHLQARGSDLLIIEGPSEIVIPELVDIYGVDSLHVELPFASEEVKRISKVKSNIAIPIHHFESRTLFREQELPFALDQLPDIFTEFRKLIEKSCGYAIQSCDDSPLPPLPIALKKHSLQSKMQEIENSLIADPRAAFKAIGGELEGLKRLQYYLADTHAISTYKETRNGLIGDRYSSKLSPWLALGALSAKRIIESVNTYEQLFTANESTYWMKFELLWREFFQWTLKKHGDAFFRADGIRGKKQLVNHDSQKIENWRLGNTPDRFVNANMKELLHTGFMSNRGRQNVASYFVHNLQQDWRIGAAWFESQLIDYDVASNWGNWMYVAGVGNDPRQDRVFNTKKQAEMYDPDGAFQDLWLYDHMAKNER
jgi:deoxyribodipyrimidine photo-lyase